jgi:CRP-like cAMP-binding protein
MSLGEVRSYPKGHVFFHPGEPADTLYWIESGRVQLYYDVEERRRVVVNCLGPGNFFGEGVLLGRVHHLTAEAVTPTTVRCIAGANLEHLYVQAPDLAVNLTLDLVRRLGHIERVYIRTPLMMMTRLAGLLLRLMDEDTRLITGYSHRHLADMLGTHREFVTQMLAAFRDQRLVETGYKRIKILDPERLRELAAGEDHDGPEERKTKGRSQSPADSTPGP